MLFRSALCAAFEGFVSDVIRDIFDLNPNVLKSKKSTLKDEELIVALQEGAALATLKDHRLRDVMYGSVVDWHGFMTQSLGMAVDFPAPLPELFVVRNAIVHSNARITKELTASGKRRFQNTGRPLSVTERDIRIYKSVVDKAGSVVWSERNRKFNRK